MARSTKKLPYVALSLLRKIQKADLKQSKAPIVTRCRSSVILKEFVGRCFAVYNGQKYIPVNVIDLMIGRKLGEFAATRTFKGHSGDKKLAKGVKKGKK